MKLFKTLLNRIFPKKLQLYAVYSEELPNHWLGNERAFTCAVTNFPLGSDVAVRYLSRRGRERVAYCKVVARPQNGDRIELSYQAFRKLENPRAERLDVTVTPE